MGCSQSSATLDAIVHREIQRRMKKGEINLTRHDPDITQKLEKKIEKNKRQRTFKRVKPEYDITFLQSSRQIEVIGKTSDGDHLVKIGSLQDLQRLREIQEGNVWVNTETSTDTRRIMTARNSQLRESHDTKVTDLKHSNSAGEIPVQQYMIKYHQKSNADFLDEPAHRVANALLKKFQQAYDKDHVVTINPNAFYHPNNT
ncbi:UNKNOWN [Stylonychia lemnae]|uniref:Uncharacterized protein n=1 Tax=Stylonychia lemnae TaxID=5949 RepID=A0A078AKB0_STYLE|nr:UNKNOWN [Stylonychia lemnae]|eukprot:CDW81243.1 UNKNOWN [Stylonychia lemnae]